MFVHHVAVIVTKIRQTAVFQIGHLCLNPPPPPPSTSSSSRQGFVTNEICLAEPASKGKDRALVEFDYVGEQSDELTLHVGDVVTILEKDVNEGWSKGELSGKIGLFPDNFVKLLPPEQPKKVRMAHLEPSVTIGQKIRVYPLQFTIELLL